MPSRKSSSSFSGASLKPAYHISWVIRMGSEKISAPPNARPVSLICLLKIAVDRLAGGSHGFTSDFR